MQSVCILCTHPLISTAWCSKLQPTHPNPSIPSELIHPIQTHPYQSTYSTTVLHPSSMCYLTSSARRNAGKQRTVYSTTLTCKFLTSLQRPKSLLRLRTYLMYTTAAIMPIGVLFDIVVVYYAKFVQPHPTQVSFLIQRPGHLPWSSGGSHQGWDGATWSNHTVSFGMTTVLPICGKFLETSF